MTLAHSEPTLPGGEPQSDPPVETLLELFEQMALIRATDKAAYGLDAPIRRVAAACVPLPFAADLEEAVIPSVERLVEAVRQTVAA